MDLPLLGGIPMMLGALWLLLGNAASVLGANALRKALRLGPTDFDFLLLLLLRLLIISSVILLCGVLGILRGWVLGSVATAALAALIRTRQNKDLPRLPLQNAGRPLLILSGIVAIRLLLQVWIFVPHLADALSYHLPKIAEWVRAGAFTRELGAHTHVTFPAGFELIETWWVLFLHHDVLIEMAGMEFVLVAFAAVLSLARNCGLGDRWSAFAALLYVLSPGFHLSATSSMNDAPAAALTLAIFAMAAERCPVPLLLAVAGIGIGLKPTFGFALPGVVVLKVLLRKEERETLQSRSAIAWVCGALGLAAGSYWYLRNLAWYGNPFYPLGERNYVDPTYVQFGPRWMSLLQNLADLVNVRIYDAVGMLGPNVDHMAGWGIGAFACGLICAVDAWRGSPTIRRLLIAFAVSLLSTLLMVQHDPWCLKYLLYIPAILVIAAAWRMEQAPEFRVLGWLALGFCFVATAFSYDLQAPHAAALAKQSWRVRAASAYSFKDFGSGSTENGVGYFGSPVGASYLLYRPDYSRRVVYLRSTELRGLIDEMTRHGIKDLFTPSATTQQKALLEEATRKGLLRKREDAWWERLP